jgi:hypothetical protein
MIDPNNILDIAKRECKGDATEEEQEWLQKPENLLAWCTALTTALSDHDSSAQFHHTRVTLLAQDAKLGGYAAEQYLEEKAKFDTWQRKSQRYRNGISNRLSQIKTLMGEDKTMSHVEEIARLTKAIVDHRHAVTNADDIPTLYDLALWSSILPVA